ncbi:ATP-dependent nuclease [Streptomyces cyslabdanicus]|uniref:ATP-dependent nuclease n=1 Tax=Streptomyces cyslabdanicus TaxID=1470456 RepID=UPI00404482D6
MSFTVFAEVPVSIECSISKAHLMSGQTLELPQKGVTVIVGPNNSGKSRFLRELYEAARGRMSESRAIVVDAEIHKTGTGEDVVSWLDSRRLRLSNNEGDFFFSDNVHESETRIPVSSFAHWEHQPELGSMVSFFANLHDTGSRLSMPLSSSKPSITYGVPRGTLQKMVQDLQVEDRISRLAEQAFGFPVCINRHEQQLELLAGKPTIEDVGYPVSEELLEQFRSFEPVANQGDGVRAFMGLLVNAITPAGTMIFIDEPEAFLHPPQARLLGRYLAEHSPDNIQIVIATHSIDVLIGILENRDTPVKIVRITRKGKGNKFTEVSPEEVRGVWADPFLRYSGILNGLFHEGIIICEGDSDCTYYQAYIDKRLHNVPVRDLLFMHVNGKARIGRALTEARRFGVPSAAIVDIDFLDDARIVRECLSSGGDLFTEMEKNLRTLQSAITQLRKPPVMRDLMDAVSSLSHLGDKDALSDEARRIVAQSIKHVSGWEQVKTGGISAVPQGEPSASMQRVIATLSEAGIFVVPVGVLERWHPGIGNKKTWVPEVLGRKLHEMENLQLNEFLGSVQQYLSASSVQ